MRNQLTAAAAALLLGSTAVLVSGPAHNSGIDFQVAQYPNSVATGSLTSAGDAIYVTEIKISNPGHQLGAFTGGNNFFYVHPQDLAIGKVVDIDGTLSFESVSYDPMATVPTGVGDGDIAPSGWNDSSNAFAVAYSPVALARAKVEKDTLVTVAPPLAVADPYPRIVWNFGANGVTGLDPNPNEDLVIWLYFTQPQTGN